MVIDFKNAEEITGTERDAIENSISTVSSTPYATAPFIRSMGIKGYPLKSNSEITRNRYATEVITQAALWEDRAQVSEVKFTDDNDIKVVIKNG